MFQSMLHNRNLPARIPAWIANRLRWLPAALFVVAVPVFLVTGGLTWAFNSIGLYEAGFEKYRISRASGISSEDLRQVALDIRGYFNSAQEPLDVRTRIFGMERAVFNDKEVHHMRDVKHLLWGVYVAFAAATACLIALLAAGYYLRRSEFMPWLARLTMWGGLLTVGLLLAFGLVAAVGFDALFLLFHRVSFANDFWMLDPRTDYLVLLFPQGFWFDATIWVALRSLGGGILLAAAGAGYLAWRRWGGTGGRFSRLPGHTRG